MANKEKLLSELRDTYVQLKPSPLSGIGVFAIRDIPKGCRSMFSRDEGEWVKVPLDEVESLLPHAREMVYNYCTFDEHYYYVEKTGFKKMDLANFINHSDSPNIVVINDGEYFEACLDIKEGEELLLNYGEVAG